MPALSRLGVILCLSALAGLAWGCTRLPMPRTETKVPGAEELYDHGLAELAAGSEASSLALLAERYPDSPWAERAGAVGILLAEERNRCRVEIDNLTAEAEALREQQLQLAEDLEQLRKLTIEMELRR